MMIKDKTINDFLIRLNLAERGWIIVDHWEADICAIGIAHRNSPRRLLYISTFNKKPGFYDYECESPSLVNSDDYETIAKKTDANFNEVLKAAEQYLV